MKVIIYKNDEGGVAIVYPTGELAIEEVARKDVPVGTPYKIVATTELPQDRTFRSAWEVEIVEPDGYGIGSVAWFTEQAEITAQKEVEVVNDNN